MIGIVRVTFALENAQPICAGSDLDARPVALSECIAHMGMSFRTLA